jgi:nondiscriminating aspartyl-tRNA synthetase
MKGQARTLSYDLRQHVGERVRVQGWLHAVRALGGLSFVVIRDGWGLVQVVVDETDAVAKEQLRGIGEESVIDVEGIAVEAAQAPGGVELHRPTVKVMEAVNEQVPIALNKRELQANLPTRLDWAVIANRHPGRRAVLRLAGAVVSGFRDSLLERGFTEIHTPKTVSAATESGANVFGIDYFGRSAYLAQSPQFYKQVMVGVFERVFEIGPAFRAEPHDTTRHLAEYVSLDVEVGFIHDHRTVMTLLRDVIGAMVDRVHVDESGAIGALGANLPHVPEVIPEIHFSSAQDLIWHRSGRDVRGEPDLSPADERDLGAWARESYDSDFLFVTGYPMRKRPFYTHPEPRRPDFSNSFDLLFRGTELVTGGQRLHRYVDYVTALQARNLPLAPFAWYLDAFRFGMPPHGGFAIGLERFLMQLLALPNVRLASAFPRDRQRVTP